MPESMTTQVVFKIDKNLKKAAQAKAKREGISLAALYKSATKSYVEGRLDVGLVYHGILTPNVKTAMLLKKFDRNKKLGKGLMGPFTSAEADAYLDNLK